MRKEFEIQLQEFAKGQVEDVISFSEFSDIAREYSVTSSEDEVIKLTLELIKDALAIGFKIGGFSRDDAEFKQWKNQEPMYVCLEVEKKWRELGKRPNIGDIAWFGLPGYEYPVR